jgi:hypothetical protein
MSAGLLRIVGCENRGDAWKRPQIRHKLERLATSAWRGFCFGRRMGTGRFLVFDFDDHISACFRDADYAVRFARWLARGRSEELSVVVSDEARSGTIVWTEPQPKVAPTRSVQQ